MTMIPRTLEGLLSHADRTSDGCLIWRGAKNGKPEPGYGYVWIDGKQAKVHRLVAGFVYGEAPSHLPFVLHSCDRPPCIEPSHLRYGSAADNVADSLRRGRHVPNRSGNRRGYHKSECKQGHKYEGENLHVLPSGAYRCRACQAMAARRYRRAS